ncbi:MAG: rhodanese-like domain-containing protein, partial [Polyangiaceae bacterium]
DPSEYAKGNPTGAGKVPRQLIKGFGHEPNPDFLPLMEKLYPDKAHRLLVVGKIGKRSLSAAEALRDAGYTELCELRPGYLGIVDDQGRYLENGWKGLGLATENETEGGSYAELRARIDV